MLGIATIASGPTLRATVKVLREVSEMAFEVKIMTGLGGWDCPGKLLVVRASIMSDFEPWITERASIMTSRMVWPTEVPEVLVPAAEVAEPAPLSTPIAGEEYIQILLARRAAHVSRNFPYGTALPLLLDRFIRAADEEFVILPERARPTKRERRPRTYRSAASLCEVRDRVAAQLDALVSKDGPPDRAAVNLSPYARSRAAARAGRRRFEQLDRDLERAGKLRARLDDLRGRILRAEARELERVPEQAPDRELAEADSGSGSGAANR